MGLFSFLGAVVPSLIGGLSARKEEKRAVARAEAQNQQQRNWQLADTAQEREWFYEDLNRNELREEAAYQRQAADLDRQVASRGVDLSKLRDQAQAAGFNPMTMLGQAGLYSTERGINLSSGGGGGVSFASSGRGFTSASAPVLSSGSFVQEAMERAVDTFTNTPPPSDPLADALRHAEAEGVKQREAEKRLVPRSFGYDLTEAKAFSPAVVSGLPPASRAEQERVSMPTGAHQVGGRNMIPVRTPDGLPGNIDASMARRLDLQPFDLISAGDWAEIVGEVGEVETALYNQSVRRAAMGRGIASRPAKSGASQRVKSAKKPKMYDPKPKAGWMDDFFR